MPSAPSRSLADCIKSTFSRRQQSRDRIFAHDKPYMKSSRAQYALILGIYVTVWAAAFTRLTGGAYVAIGIGAACGYGAGQLLALVLRRHVGLSADPFALPLAMAMTVLGTWVGVTRGILHLGGELYLDLLERFLSAFAIGHLVVLLLAGVMEALTRTLRRRRMD